MSIVIPTLPTIDPDCDVTHSWLNYPVDKVGPYNNFDCVAAALARRVMPEILAQSGNAEYFERWNATVVPVALNMQRRGFGHLDEGRLTDYKRKLNAELGGIESRLLGATQLFERLRREADVWRDEHAAKDLADAHAKNAKRKRPLETVELTRDKQRRIGYESRLRAIDEARESFLNSPKRKAEWLFGELEFKRPPATRKRSEDSTDQHALAHIYRHLRKRDEVHKWVLEDLVHRSRLNTIRTRYLDIPTGPSGRVYPFVRVYASETLRWSYSNPPLHQWVPEIRHLIVARSGHVFIGADWSALEARISAHFCGEAKDIAAFSDPARDVHIETALELFGLHKGITPAEVEVLRAEHKRGVKFAAAYAVVCPGWAALSGETRSLMRGVAKGYRYETLYGGSGLGNQAKVHCFCPRPQCVESAPSAMSMTPQERRDISRRWAASRPATVRWQEELFSSVIRNGKKWRSPFGYTRQFFGPADSLRTTILNCPMQTTAGELLNKVVVELGRLGAPLVFQHHDQPVLEVPDDAHAIADYSAMLRETMEAPVAELGGVRFPVDLHVSADWAGLK